jgi:SpoVK/Ycf46/Vps4 family AAA+-type ATPase
MASRKPALSVTQRRHLDDIVATVNRRRAQSGLIVLFTGPSGTGKTMAAEVIASELGRSVRVVGAGRIVSKYIGETEKNLERVFADAARAGAVLFFDEADALFGKRSTVRDSHDRYANVEVAYLLQRLEDFNGVAILSSNLKSNIDPAFQRRLRFVVEFSRAPR